MTQEDPAAAVTPSPGGPTSAAPDESPGVLLWRASLRWQRAIAASLRPLGLTHVQFVILTSVWRLTHLGGESPTQRRLADHAGTDPMMTSQVLRTLQAKGLITRSQDPADSRTRLLGVTRQGATLAGRAIAIVAAADDDFFASAGDASVVVEMLRRLDR